MEVLLVCAGPNRPRVTRLPFDNGCVNWRGLMTFAREDVISAVIPEGVTALEQFAFENCLNLVYVAFPLTLTRIGYRAFYNCQRLVSVVLPENVVNVGYLAFGGCTNLAAVSWRRTHGPTLIQAQAFFGCSALREFHLPVGVEFVNAHTFRNCTELAAVSVSHGVKNIGNRAFYGCESLVSIALPAACTVDESAFMLCSRLRFRNTGIPATLANALDFWTPQTHHLCNKRRRDMVWLLHAVLWLRLNIPSVAIRQIFYFIRRADV